MATARQAQRDELEVTLLSLQNQVQAMWSVIVQNNHGVVEIGNRLDHVANVVDRLVKVKGIETAGLPQAPPKEKVSLLIGFSQSMHRFLLMRLIFLTMMAGCSATSFFTILG